MPTTTELPPPGAAQVRTNEDLLILASDLREFCDQTFVSYMSFRSSVKVSNDFPAYELAKLYLNIATAWLPLSNHHGLGLNLCKLYLAKCIDVFDNPSIDVCKNAQSMLARVSSTLKSMSTWVKSLEKEMSHLEIAPVVDRQAIGLAIMRVARVHLHIGNFDRVQDYMKYIDETFTDDEMHRVRGFADQWAEMVLLARFGNVARAQLDLQESLMFLDEDDHTEIELGFKDTNAEVRNTLRKWKEECKRVHDVALCRARFVKVEELNEQRARNLQDRVRSGREVLVIAGKNNRRYSLGFAIRVTNNNKDNKENFEYREEEVKDRLLLEMLSNRKFTNSVSSNLIKRLNIVLQAMSSAIFVTPVVKNRILVLANRKDLSFYLYLCVSLNNNTPPMVGRQLRYRIVGDLVFPTRNNPPITQLWSLFYQVFSGQIVLPERDLVRKLTTDYRHVFYGALAKKLPLLRAESFETIYQKLSLAYEILGNRPLASEYARMLVPSRIQGENGARAKNELLRLQIASQSGLTLPGDFYLNKTLKEDEFFDLVLPKINQINHLNKSLHPSLVIMTFTTNSPISNDNLFDLFGNAYEQIQKRAVNALGRLISSCFLIYSTHSKSWSVMFRLSGGANFQGIVDDLSEIAAYKSDLKSVLSLLVNLKTDADFRAIPNEDEVDLRLVAAVSTRCKHSFDEIERIMNRFAQAHILDTKNRMYSSPILMNDRASSPNNISKVYDLTTIEGVIQLKTDIKSARQGYWVQARKLNNNLSTNGDEGKDEIVQIIDRDGEIIVRGRMKSGEWMSKSMNEELEESELGVLRKSLFESMKIGGQRRIFVSPTRNELLYAMIERSFEDNSHAATKSLSEDVFYGLIKVEAEHYVALGIIRENKNEEKSSKNTYKIFLADPRNSMINYVEFLETTSREYHYEFDPRDGFVICHRDKPVLANQDDTLIRAYLALATMRSAWQTGDSASWQFFLGFYSYQTIGSTRNIELIKTWMLEQERREQNKSALCSSIKIESTGDRVLDILGKLDATKLDDTPVGVNLGARNLKALLAEAHESARSVNRVARFELKNAIAFNLLKEVDLNQAETVKILNKLKTIIAGMTEAIDERRIAKIEKTIIEASLKNGRELTFEIREFLREMLSDERNDLVVQIVSECQRELNRRLKDVFARVVNTRADLNTNMSNDSDMRNFLLEIKKFLVDNDLNSVQSFVKFANFISVKIRSDANDPATNLEILCKLWSDNFANREIPNRKEFKKFLKKNSKSVFLKVGLYTSLLSPFVGFVDQFVSNVMNEYGHLGELRDVYKIVYEKIESVLRASENVVDMSIPAHEQAHQVDELAKSYAKLSFIDFPTMLDDDEEDIQLNENTEDIKQIAIKNNQVLIWDENDSSYLSYQVTNQEINDILDGGIRRIILDSNSINRLLKYLEDDLKINIGDIMYENASHEANSLGQLGNLQVREAAIELSTRLPTYIAQYRLVSAECLEHLYETLHSRFVHDLDTLNRRIEFEFCEETNELPTYEQNTIKVFLKKLAKDGLEMTFEAGFYCPAEKRFMSGKTFKTSKIFFTSGSTTFDEDLETEILNSIGYYDLNKPEKTLISTCTDEFKREQPKERALSNILTALIKEPRDENNHDLLARLSLLLPHMQTNRCGTSALLNDYLKMIFDLVDSFKEIFAVLMMIKRELWHALVERFDLVPNEHLASTLRSEILDKLSAHTRITQILTCFDGLKFEKKSHEIQQTLNKLDDSFENRGDLKGKHACASLLRHFVITLVEKFMDTLVRQRERLVETFNTLEPMLDELFSSFFVLENRSQFESSLEQRLMQIKSNKNDLTTFFKVYMGTLDDILRSWPEQALTATKKSILSQYFEYLTSSSRHFVLVDYQNRLNNLRKLLENFTDPYDIDVSENHTDDRITVNARVKSSILSHLLTKIRSSSRRGLQSGDELRIINSGRVYLDIDLNDFNMLAGVNVVLVGVSFVLAPGKADFQVDTSGLNADPAGISQQASSGKDGKEESPDGTSGEDGVDGLPGGHAGNVFIFAAELPDPNSVQVSTRGGDGSAGQIGGNGGNGYDGADGKSATKKDCKEAFWHDVIGDYVTGWKVNYFSGVSWKLGSPAKDGGNGGDSGHSGFGGDSGESGTIGIKSSSSSSSSFVNKIQENGKKGDDGDWQKAKPGKAGKRGQDGKTMLMTADIIRLYQINGKKDDERNINFYSCKCYEPGKIQESTGFKTKTKKERSTKSGFCYRSAAGDYTLASWCKPYVDTDALDDYDSRQDRKSNAKKGEPKHNKHKNKKKAKKIHVINTEQVYQETKKFFNKLSESGSEECQAWQSSKLASFMKSFAAELSHDESYGVSENKESMASVRAQISNMLSASLQQIRQQEAEIAKSKSGEHARIGMKQQSLGMLNEIQQIAKNQHLWKNLKSIETKQEKEILVNKPKQGELDPNDERLKRNNLRVIESKPEEVTRKTVGGLQLGRSGSPDLSQVKESDLSELEKFNIERINRVIRDLKDGRVDLRPTTFKYITDYTVDDLVECLEKVKRNRLFLKQLEHELPESVDGIFGTYLTLIQLDVELIGLLKHQGMQLMNIYTLVSKICKGLSSSEDQQQQKADLNLLAHKVILIDCIQLLRSLLDLVRIGPEELKRIINGLNAFYNLAQVWRSLRGFSSGEFRELKKSIVKNLLRDTIKNCFPTLIDCIVTIDDRQMMRHIHPDLLSILYNKLQVEYQSCNVKLVGEMSTEIPSYLSVKSEEFRALLGELNQEYFSDEEIIADFDLRKQLAQESLTGWSNLLGEVRLSIAFRATLERSNIPIGGTKRKADCLRLLNSFRQQLPKEKFERIFDIEKESFGGEPNDPTDPLNPFYRLLLSLYINKINLNDVEDVKKNFKYAEWVTRIKQLVEAERQYVEPKQRSIKNIIETLGEQNASELDSGLLQRMEANLEKIDKLVKVKKAEIDDTLLDHPELLRSWLESAHNNNKFNDLCETVSILAAAWYIENKQIPKQTQLTALLLFVESNSCGKSLLEQINTGEGKTLTVGLTAAYLALVHEKFVDVVSSNRDLAMDGEKKCAAFFTLLGLTSNHNCHVQEQDRVRAYKCNIVYGEVSAFQGDMLDTQFNRHDICAERYKDMKRVCLVVDEVDSMCVDKAKDVLYLSHNIEALKWIESLFVIIWVSVLRSSSEDGKVDEKMMNEMCESLLEGIESKTIAVPGYLKPYVKSKLRIWIENAFQAKAMEANDEFVIDKSRDSDGGGGEKKIIVLDKDVGVEMYSSRWSNGLAQFLELKYRRKISVESLKAVFMSNKKFFELYSGRLFGLTGTLGTNISRRFLREVYKTSFVIIPTSYAKSYYNETPKIATTPKEWLAAIGECVREQSQRPVLIITDTVQNAELITNHLRSEGVVSQNKLRSYTRDSDEVEKYYHANPATSGDVIVATNKGGRGTDITISDVNNKEHGGLHVIVTFLPANDRIEEQAFGRTSRNGKPGSGQFVLLVDESEDSELSRELVNLDDKGRAARLDEMAPAILQRKKDERNRAAELFLDNLLKTGILHLDIEQQLFDRFKTLSEQVCQQAKPAIDQHLKRLDDITREEAPAYVCYYGRDWMSRCGLLESALDSIGGYERFLNLNWKKFHSELSKHLIKDVFGRELDEFVMAVIKDEWAFWLDSVQQRISSSTNMGILDSLRKELDARFEKYRNVNLKNITDLLDLTEFPEQHLRLAQIFLRQGEIKMAETCFERATKKEDPLGAGYLGMAYCRVPWTQKKESEQEDFKIKKRVRYLLKKASWKMDAMKRTLQTGQMFGTRLAELTQDNAGINRFVGADDNFFSAQCESKMAVLETHTRFISRAIGSSLTNEYVFAEGNEKEFEKSKEIYLKMVACGLIHHNRVRREWVSKQQRRELNQDALELIRTNLDRSVSEPVIELLNSRIDFNHIEEDKFLEISKDGGEFWNLVKSCWSQLSQQVNVLDMKKALEELTDEHRTAFNELIGRYQVRLMSLDKIPDEPSKIFGETATIFRLTGCSEIYFYHRFEAEKWRVTQLTGSRLIERCDQLPSKEIVTQKPNVVFFVLERKSFSYSFYSRVKKEVVEVKYKNEASQEYFEEYHNTANPDSLILFDTVGNGEEPLHQLNFDANISVEISPFSRQPESQLIYKTILSHPDISTKSIDAFDLRQELFDTPAKLKLWDAWQSSGLITKQERILVENTSEFLSALKKFLENHFDKRVASKYVNIAYSGQKDNGLYKFFEDFFASKKKCGEEAIRNYFYSSEVPFRTRKDEAETTLKVLHDIRVLKSGGLALKPAENINESKYAYKEFKKYIDDRMPSECSAYVDNLVGLQGEIRSYRDGLKAWLRQFSELPSSNAAEPADLPDQLEFFGSVGLTRVLVLEENKKFHMNWAAFFVFILGVAQVLLGCYLCAIGLANVGQALISEGISDMCQGMMGMITGNFSLADWAQAKLISLTISILTLGFSGASAANQAVGSLTKAQIFAKALIKAGVEFGLQVAGDLIYQNTIGKLMEAVNEAIVNELKPAIEKQLNLNQIKEKLKQLRSQKGNIAYKQALEQLKKDMSNVLRDKSLSELISNLTTLKKAITQVMNAMKEQPSGGDVKQKIVQSMFKQGVKSLAINTAINFVKLSEIPKVMFQVNNLVANYMIKIEKDLQTSSSNDSSQDLKEQQEQQIDQEIDNFCSMMSNRISSDIVGFINGIANGVFRLGMSAASSAINNKIDEKLTKRFERKNEIKRRDDECRQIQKDRATKKSTTNEEQKKKTEKKIESDVVSPKGSADEDTDMNVGHAQMKANKEGRSVKIRDMTTGEIITIEPEGIMGKIMAAFKDEIVVDFVQNEDGGGHFKTGVGSEKFIQKDGGRDCFVIAAEESLGREVTEETVKQRRKSLENYTKEHSDEYNAALEKSDEKGQSHVEGGATKGGGRSSRNRQRESGIKKSTSRTPSEKTKQTREQSVEKIGKELNSQLDMTVDEAMAKHTSDRRNYEEQLIGSLYDLSVNDPEYFKSLEVEKGATVQNEKILKGTKYEIDKRGANRPEAIPSSTKKSVDNLPGSTKIGDLKHVDAAHTIGFKIAGLDPNKVENPQTREQVLRTQDLLGNTNLIPQGINTSIDAQYDRSQLKEFRTAITHLKAGSFSKKDDAINYIRNRHSTNQFASNIKSTSRYTSLYRQ